MFSKESAQNIIPCKLLYIISANIFMWMGKALAHTNLYWWKSQDCLTTT